MIKSKLKFLKNENSAKEHTTGAHHTTPSQRQTESTVPYNSSSQRAIQV